MKIAVLGIPRSGSTKLCFLLERLFSVRYLGEVLTPLNTTEEKLTLIKSLSNQDDYIVKFFKYQIDDVGIDSVNWGQFDMVFISYRESVVDTFVSWYIARKRSQWIRGINLFKIDSDFTVDTEMFEEWYTTHMNNFDKIIASVSSQTKTPVISFSYDELSSTNIEMILNKIPNLPLVNPSFLKLSLPVSPTGIDYKTKCLNYNEVITVANKIGVTHA